MLSFSILPQQVSMRSNSSRTSAATNVAFGELLTPQADELCATLGQIIARIRRGETEPRITDLSAC
jgi:hypothetical protein